MTYYVSYVIDASDNGDEYREAVVDCWGKTRYYDVLDGGNTWNVTHLNGCSFAYDKKKLVYCVDECGGEPVFIGTVSASWGIRKFLEPPTGFVYLPPSSTVINLTDIPNNLLPI